MTKRDFLRTVSLGLLGALCAPLSGKGEGLERAVEYLNVHKSFGVRVEPANESGHEWWSEWQFTDPRDGKRHGLKYTWSNECPDEAARQKIDLKMDKAVQRIMRPLQGTVK